jgi:hypothetical protein
VITYDRLEVAHSESTAEVKAPFLGIHSVEENFHFMKINFILLLCHTQTIILVLLYIRVRCNTLIILDLSGKMTMGVSYIGRCQSYILGPIVISLKFGIKWRRLLTLNALGKEIK